MAKSRALSFDEVQGGRCHGGNAVDYQVVVPCDEGTMCEVIDEKVEQRQICLT